MGVLVSSIVASRADEIASLDINALPLNRGLRFRARRSYLYQVPLDAGCVSQTYPRVDSHSREKATNDGS